MLMIKNILNIRYHFLEKLGIDPSNLTDHSSPSFNLFHYSHFFFIKPWISIKSFLVLE